MDNSSDFRESFKKSNQMLDTGGLVPKRDKIIRTAKNEMTDRQLKKAGYDAFNIGLVNHDEHGNAVSKKFYDKLKEQGYNAVADINDKKYSGYKSKAPVIVFDKADKISISAVKKMTEEQVASNLHKAYKSILLEQAMQESVAYGGIITASVAGVVGKKRVNDYYNVTGVKKVKESKR